MGEIQSVGSIKNMSYENESHIPRLQRIILTKMSSEIGSWLVRGNTN